MVDHHVEYFHSPCCSEYTDKKKTTEKHVYFYKKGF